MEGHVNVRFSAGEAVFVLYRDADGEAIAAAKPIEEVVENWKQARMSGKDVRGPETWLRGMNPSMICMPRVQVGDAGSGAVLVVVPDPEGAVGPGGRFGQGSFYVLGSAMYDREDGRKDVRLGYENDIMIGYRSYQGKDEAGTDRFAAGRRSAGDVKRQFDQFVVAMKEMPISKSRDVPYLSAISAEGGKDGPDITD